MAPFFDDEVKVDNRVGFMNRFPEKVRPIFLKSLDLETRNILRLISLVDHEIVDSVKVDIDVVTFFDEGTILTAQKKKDEECFLRIKKNEYDPSRIGYILTMFDIKELRVMRTQYMLSLIELDYNIENNSAYVQDYRCEEYDTNAHSLLQKCIAGQLKNVNLNMPHPPKSIESLFYVPAVTCARKFHIIHREDSPVLLFTFIKRWVQHADLQESVGRKIVTEGHSQKSIDNFMDRVKGCDRDIINVKGIPSAGVLPPNDSRFLILIVVKTIDDDKRRLTLVVIPKNAKVKDYAKYIRIPEDDVEKKRKEKEREQKENSTGGIDIEKKDDSITFEKDCSFIDSAELPNDLL